MKPVHLFCIAVGLSLSACAVPYPGDSAGSYRIPAPVPAAPMAPPVTSGGDLPAQPLYAQQSDDYNIPGVREVHAVASILECQQMATQFRQQGRRLRLTRSKPTNNPTLRYLCIFEGPDAVENYFADPRYNNSGEY